MGIAEEMKMTLLNLAKASLYVNICLQNKKLSIKNSHGFWNDLLKLNYIPSFNILCYSMYY